MNRIKLSRKIYFVSCVCDKGYELLKGTCEDINECLDDPCSDTERCSNVEGSIFSAFLWQHSLTEILFPHSHLQTTFLINSTESSLSAFLQTL